MDHEVHDELSPQHIKDKTILAICTDLRRVGLPPRVILGIDPKVFSLIATFEDPDHGLLEEIGNPQANRINMDIAQIQRVPVGQSNIAGLGRELMRRTPEEQIFENVSEDWALLRAVTRRAEVGFSDRPTLQTRREQKDDVRKEKHQMKSSCYVLLDASGSMSKWLEYVKALAVVLAVRNWKTGGETYFRGFGSSKTELVKAATPSQYEELIGRILLLTGMGGTDIIPALQKIKADVEGKKDVLGQAVIITDGLCESPDETLPLGKEFPTHAILAEIRIEEYPEEIPERVRALYREREKLLQTAQSQFQAIIEKHHGKVYRLQENPIEIDRIDFSERITAAANQKKQELEQSLTYRELLSKEREELETFAYLAPSWQMRTDLQQLLDDDYRRELVRKNFEQFQSRMENSQTRRIQDELEAKGKLNVAIKPPRKATTSEEVSPDDLFPDEQKVEKERNSLWQFIVRKVKQITHIGSSK